MATHSSVLAQRIPWTREPGGLQPMGVAKSQTRLKQLNTHTHTHTHTCQSEKQNQQDVYIKRFIISDWLMQLWKLTILDLQRGLASQRPTRANDAGEVQRLSMENSLLLGETCLFVLFRSLTDWMRPIHIMEDNLLIPNSLISVLSSSKAHSKLTHRMNYHSPLWDKFYRF